MRAGEFVNPKYTDGSKLHFKSPTRLECMMQDYPKVLRPGARVGFTTSPPWFCYSPVKNNVKDAALAVKKTAGFPPACAMSGWCILCERPCTCRTLTQLLLVVVQARATSTSCGRN